MKKSKLHGLSLTALSLISASVMSTTQVTKAEPNLDSSALCTKVKKELVATGSSIADNDLKACVEASIAIFERLKGVVTRPGAPKSESEDNETKFIAELKNEVRERGGDLEESDLKKCVSAVGRILKRAKTQGAPKTESHPDGATLEKSNTQKDPAEQQGEGEADKDEQAINDELKKDLNTSITGG